MRTHVFSGKGGVGKTTDAVSLGLYLSSRGQKTAIIDYDGGHSVTNTLGIPGHLRSNLLHDVLDNLHVAIVDNFSFNSITTCKERGIPLEQYLDQFPGELGIIPLADMVNAFFGVPTDVPALQKFTVLIEMLESIASKGFDNIIIDVEPTAGFERLVSNAKAMVKSLENLRTQGRINLAILKAKWPDIGGYLKGSYIKNADVHCEKIEETVVLIRQAIYYLVCTPELGPVKQTFDVKRIIGRFGGSVFGTVVNGTRGEKFEAQNLKLLEPHMLPILRLGRKDELHHAHTSIDDRREILTRMGDLIARKFLTS